MNIYKQKQKYLFTNVAGIAKICCYTADANVFNHSIILSFAHYNTIGLNNLIQARKTVNTI